jgi:nucleoid-associated protein YgaU
MTCRKLLAQRHNTRQPLLAAATLALAFMLTACGGGGGDPEPTLTPVLPTQAPTLEAAPLPTSTPEPAQTQEYTVEAGDSLTAIAEQFGVTVEALAAANNITNPDQIQVGQTLTIPAP